jgi:hypothetical protein
MDKGSERADLVLKLGAATTLGYLLGRTRRMKWAVGVGIWYVSRSYGIRPGELALEAVQRFLGSEQVSGLSNELGRASADRARQTLIGGAEWLADMLHEKTQLLNRSPDEGARQGPSGREGSASSRSIQRGRGQTRSAAGSRSRAPRPARAERSNTSRRALRRAA